jgi:hypothetical protein
MQLYEIGPHKIKVSSRKVAFICARQSSRSSVTTDYVPTNLFHTCSMVALTLAKWKNYQATVGLGHKVKYPSSCYPDS